MGRNAIGKGNVLVCFAVSKDFEKRLNDLVKASGISRPEYIRGVLSEAIRRKLTVRSHKTYTFHNSENPKHQSEVTA